jgi:hypothetical protein
VLLEVGALFVGEAVGQIDLPGLYLRGGNRGGDGPLPSVAKVRSVRIGISNLGPSSD